MGILSLQKVERHKYYSNILNWILSNSFLSRENLIKKNSMRNPIQSKVMYLNMIWFFYALKIPLIVSHNIHDVIKRIKNPKRLNIITNWMQWS